MKDIIEEYGMFIAAAIGGVAIIGILAMAFIPGSPINELLMAVMPQKQRLTTFLLPGVFYA